MADQPEPDPKLRLETVARDWDCTQRHLLNLEKVGKLRIMRFGPRFLRIALSEKTRFEKEALKAAPDTATGERLVAARKRKREAAA